MKDAIGDYCSLVGSALSLRARVIVWFERVPRCLLMYAHVLSKCTRLPISVDAVGCESSALVLSAYS